MNVEPAPSEFLETLYGRVATIIHREAGIVLGQEKTSMMRARLGKRISSTGTGSLAGYLQLLEGQGAVHEMPYFVSALTTNVTHFFRESHHFDFLREHVAPAQLDARRQSLQIWSAGCSSGQEPYSIAMTLLPASQPGKRMPDLSILATDIDAEILRRAEQAEYTRAEIASVPRHLVETCFDTVVAGHVAPRRRISPALRSTVRFRQLNLHANWHIAVRFDVIFCRNVVIYFDPAAQARLWDRFYNQLRPGGWLIVGHSERVPAAMRDRLRPAGRTIYQSHPPDR